MQGSNSRNSYPGQPTRVGAHLLGTVGARNGGEFMCRRTMIEAQRNSPPLNIGRVSPVVKSTTTSNGARLAFDPSSQAEYQSLRTFNTNAKRDNKQLRFTRAKTRTKSPKSRYLVWMSDDGPGIRAVELLHRFSGLCMVCAARRRELPYRAVAPHAGRRSPDSRHRSPGRTPPLSTPWLPDLHLHSQPDPTFSISPPTGYYLSKGADKFAASAS